LKAKRFGAVGLDVCEGEAEYFFQDSSEKVMSDDVMARLLSFYNVVMT
jgi:D-lactate dehydrogenase